MQWRERRPTVTNWRTTTTGESFLRTKIMVRCWESRLLRHLHIYQINKDAMHYACTLLNVILTMNCFIWLIWVATLQEKIRKIPSLTLPLLTRFFTDRLQKYVRLLKSEEGSAKVICFVKIPNFCILLNWKKKLITDVMLPSMNCYLPADYRNTMALIWRVLSNDVASI